MFRTFGRKTELKRKRYPAEEHKSFVIPMEDLLVDGELELYPEVDKQDFFRLRFQDGKLVFQPGAYVGLIPINDRVVVDVQPRSPISNLTRLLDVTQHRPVQLQEHSRVYEVQEELLPSLLDSLTQALISAIHIIEVRGRHYEYHKRIQHTSFPRGRILMGRTATHYTSRGISHRVITSQYKRSSDTAPNRCLKYAIWYVAQRYIRMQERGGIKRLLGNLNRIYHLFDDVELDHSRRFLQHPLVVDTDNLPLNYSHYQRALNVAAVIIEGKGVRLEGVGTDVAMASHFIKLDDVFEDYVRIVLQRELVDLQPRILILDGNLAGEKGGQKGLFDDTDEPEATPDIVVLSSVSVEINRRYPLVIEVKYKPLRGAPKRQDLNQLIAYAASYRTRVALIVQPTATNDTSTVTPLGRIGSTLFYQCGINLSEENIKSEEENFASRVRELVDLASAQPSGILHLDFRF